MFVRRLISGMSLSVAVMALSAVPAFADDYPPSVAPSSEVKGTQFGKLPHTGFDLTWLALAVALLAIGAVLLVATRRRGGSH